MRVIDENRGAAGFPNALEPPRSAVKRLQRLEDGVRFATSRDA